MATLGLAPHADPRAARVVTPRRWALRTQPRAGPGRHRDVSRLPRRGQGRARGGGSRRQRTWSVRSNGRASVTAMARSQPAHSAAYPLGSRDAGPRSWTWSKAAWAAHPAAIRPRARLGGKRAAAANTETAAAHSGPFACQDSGRRAASSGSRQRVDGGGRDEPRCGRRHLRGRQTSPQRPAAADAHHNAHGRGYPVPSRRPDPNHDRTLAIARPHSTPAFLSAAMPGRSSRQRTTVLTPGAAAPADPGRVSCHPLAERMIASCDGCRPAARRGKRRDRSAHPAGDTETAHQH
jgi:hypothetical protein